MDWRTEGRADDLMSRGIGLVIQSMGLDTRNGSNPTAKLMLAVIGAIAHDAERVIMRSHAAGTQGLPGFRRVDAPHNAGWWRGGSLRGRELRSGDLG